MKTYCHTQRAGRWLIVPLAASMAMIAAAYLTGLWPVLSGVPVLALMSWLFASLTIEIDGTELRWRFGPGLIRKRISLTEVSQYKPVETSLAEGWGIRLSRFGWLYNVAGYSAVAIQLHSGTQFALGTDDPAGLIAALASGMTAT